VLSNAPGHAARHDRGRNALPESLEVCVGPRKGPATATVCALHAGAHRRRSSRARATGASSVNAAPSCGVYGTRLLGDKRRHHTAAQPIISMMISRISAQTLSDVRFSPIDFGRSASRRLSVQSRAADPGSFSLSCPARDEYRDGVARREGFLQSPVEAAVQLRLRINVGRRFIAQSIAS
jgi:hypothetical protein